MSLDKLQDVQATGGGEQLHGLHPHVCKAFPMQSCAMF